MKDLDKLKQILNEPVTINNLNRINDYFIRYLFSHRGNENIALNFINAVFKDLDFETFKKIEILNPFNIAENYDEKESIVDIKATTETGITVLIEIQARGNENFIKRTLYYWAYNYSSNLNRGSIYDELKAVVSINITNFILTDENKVHSCYVLKELNNNKILTDHCQLHFIELPKFNVKNITKMEELHKDFISWIKFFKGDNMSNLIKENTIFEEVENKCNTFVNDRPVMDKYKKREVDAYFFDRSMELDLKKAKEEGIEQGEKNKAISMAKNMKARDMDIKLISELTGLSIEEIEKL
ncbi:Rpn family recombination-promoting nuclease/putative transposase [Brachyspira pilosicoli]|uniref:Rpn family recombination-promoting nuclease/putative transposase n=1 Tax=Brachyspira pilosicoli TaxID=52584 RepID=A0A5C8EHJ5_BRAPL|nr:Rpn family recombination-promoting nuclease/putative transposase [Brachyspira pilosicoli]TXJ37203.1 Rpn family recombination-promoting nuclease/putative transposase [Brachyspira pilosicoli]